MTKTLTTSALGLALALVFTLGASSAFAATDDDQPIVGTPSISESRAVTLAEDAYTGSGKFTDIELEMEKGVLVYSVEFTESSGNEVDVKLNAKTGAVVLIESDATEAVDDDQGDDEDDASTNDRAAKIRMLIDLLNQLLALLKAQGN